MGSFFFFLSICTAIGLLRYYGDRDKRYRAYSAACLPPPTTTKDIVFTGKDAGVPVEEIHRILLKRNSYYAALEQNLQQRFLKRVQAFMKEKIFIIKDDEGFREMPVLTSAAAIQLTFGLPHYRLPFYKYIRIYPEEFFGENSFTVLVGRVQGNVITIAWNHLLFGNNHPSDGSNVGLHEMSHALYIQKIVIEENYAPKFNKKYTHLISECHEAFQIEKEGIKDLYTSYANTNLQEFWAESVELFFEKPEALNNQYPDVYRAMILLLGQNPLNRSNPIVSTQFTQVKKFKRIIRLLWRKKLRKENKLNQTA